MALTVDSVTTTVDSATATTKPAMALRSTAPPTALAANAVVKGRFVASLNT